MKRLIQLKIGKLPLKTPNKGKIHLLNPSLFYNLCKVIQLFQLELSEHLKLLQHAPCDGRQQYIFHLHVQCT